LSEDETDTDSEEIDAEDTLLPRAPIVTIMGHVDHGKTTLLDYIRKTRVTESEAGGITQHIGAYSVTTNSGKRITFLDTPGHEAFTAMRARGAKVTDVAIIVIAADDSVMPQTKEAINHAQAAGVPIVFAINKIDKEGANVERIYEQLAQMNLLVEEWGGKYQSQKISAKKGLAIDELLEKVLLEAELLDLKSNPNKKASGTVIEASLDKGKGYVATMLVQNGKLSVGDVVLAGNHYGKVKAMYDDVGKRIKTAGPSTPIQILGLDGAPQAGDKFKVMDTEREAREIANKRQQVSREQTLRTRKHISLDEIGRRLALGNFKELRVIVKGDVDGSVEALSDSLLKLSTPEIQVSVLYKAVGQISESDVLLASASDAIIIGFQVRPSSGARKLAENEQIQIKLYSIIYNAINDVKAAIEGMLAPKTEEVVVGTAEVRDTFKVSKVGTVAGCLVVEGSIKKGTQVRLIRDGIVIFTGDLDSLKRFKDDVSEVRAGTECGISIKNFNDIKVGDIIESFEERELKKTL
jgi:translation initiation factor IF-2